MSNSHHSLSSTPKDAPIDWQCFSYLTAERSITYRAIIDVFAAAKAEFSLHLRPAEIRTALGWQSLSLEMDELDSALQQLEAWGNLQSYQDKADVASLADYYRKSLLYQLTAAGEAAHASTLTFAERLAQQAKLDARALERIADGAGQLERLIQQLRVQPDSIDSMLVLTTLRSLCQDADELTSRAQSFFRWLHEQTESDRNDLQAFLAYKERLIDYLQQFVGELITTGNEIATRLNRISKDEYTQLAQLTAVEEIGLPRAGEEAEHPTRIRESALRWRQRLVGLCGWFSRQGTRPAQLEQLRAAARAAIPRLIQLAGQMNDQQSGRSDRVADLRTLATHFLRCRNDAEAHQLFRAAFALSPCRHLRIDLPTIEDRDQNPIKTSERWVDARPVEFSPQLRKSGRQPGAAPHRRIVDRSEQRAAAKRRLQMETGKKDSSRETLIALGKRKLSQIGELDHDAFHLLLELIELANAHPTPHRNRAIPQIIRATSRDGSVQIALNPLAAAANSDVLNGPSLPNDLSTLDAHYEYRVAENRRALAKIYISSGCLMLPDRWMEVTRAL